MQISILKPGIFTTVQDLGRNDYLGQGVPLSGAMDHLSATLANVAIGNDEHEATLEFSYANAEILTQTDLMFSYCGYGAVLVLNDKTLPPARPIFVIAGSVIKFINSTVGSRTYVAVAGGWDVPDIMGSKSTYVTGGFGGLMGRTLRKGDILSSRNKLTPTTARILKDLKQSNRNYQPWSIVHNKFGQNKSYAIRIVPGPEFSWFDSGSILNFITESFEVSINSNRMGLNLLGLKVKRKIVKELLSTAVVPGSIQVSGNGNLILLMADCQTTGGYPRIAQVAAVDLHICGQLMPADRINFVAISKEEAEILYLDQRKLLAKIKASIENKYQ